MEFGFASYIDKNLNSKLAWINDFENEMNIHFKDKFYGDDLLKIYIGIVCVHPDFKSFFTPRQPTYHRQPKTYIKDGIQYSVGYSLEYDIGFNFEYILNCSMTELRTHVINKIENSFQLINNIKRIKDFDSEMFFVDIKNFLHERL